SMTCRVSPPRCAARSASAPAEPKTRAIARRWSAADDRPIGRTRASADSRRYRTRRLARAVCRRLLSWCRLRHRDDLLFARLHVRTRFRGGDARAHVVGPRALSASHRGAPHEQRALLFELRTILRILGLVDPDL